MLVRLPLCVCVCVCILVGCFILTCLLNAIAIILQLWEATISHAPVMVPQLLAYFPCLVEIMERSFDHLQVRLHQSPYNILHRLSPPNELFLNAELKKKNYI